MIGEIGTNPERCPGFGPLVSEMTSASSYDVAAAPQEWLDVAAALEATVGACVAGDTATTEQLTSDLADAVDEFRAWTSGR